jgi:hypothetical protein
VSAPLLPADTEHLTLPEHRALATASNRLIDISWRTLQLSIACGADFSALCTGFLRDRKWQVAPAEKLRDRDRSKNLLKNIAFLSMGAIFFATSLSLSLCRQC